MHEYNCIINDIVDGDTVDVDIDLGFSMWMKNVRVRLIGIDAPESRTSDETVRKYGLLAKKRLKELLPIGSKQIVSTTLDKEKFGRTLGDFSNAETKSLTKLLLSEGHAIEYCDDKELRKQRFEINRIKIDKQYA